MSINEKTLIKNVKDSNRISFQKLFYQFHDQLFRFVVYRVQDADIAKDITQETFLRIWEKRESLQPEKSFFSLLARISTNLCYDHFRYTEVRLRNKDRIPEFGKSHFDNPEEVVQAKAIEEIIRKLVNEKLPQRCRVIFILSRIEGFSNQEISTKLSLSIRTVENQIYRALKILKKHMKKYL
ncbi:MAG: RNA polymerase sigma factor [Candidatus Neomarinimicrobiota bacterium]|tara:strand:- start:727 stop:1272 length:546 start_codon:yes stop_codon:yes gene_type:complete